MKNRSLFPLWILLLSFSYTIAQPKYNIPNQDPTHNNLVFIKNEGQLTDISGSAVPEVLYYTNVGQEKVFIYKNGFSLVNTKSSVDSISPDTLFQVDFILNSPTNNSSSIRSSKKIKIHEIDPIDNKLNFFLNRPAIGTTDVPAFKKLIFEDVFNKIDLQFSSNNVGFSISFIVHPGGDPNDVIIECNGQLSLSISSNRFLQVGTIPSTIAFDQVHAFQFNPLSGIINVKPISLLLNSNNIACNIGAPINNNLPTVITLNRGQSAGGSIGQTTACKDWSTYQGESGDDEAMDITVDTDGFSYHTGTTQSELFPNITGASVQPDIDLERDAFVLKFNPEGVPIWGTFYGGDGDDIGQGIALNSLGDVYIVGSTKSTDFPIEPALGSSLTGQQDGFVVRLNNDGDQIQFAQYIGGDEIDEARNVAIDSEDNVYIVGRVEAAGSGTIGFPIVEKVGGFNDDNFGEPEDGFIVEYDQLNVQVWGSFFGGDNADNFADIVIGNEDKVIISGSSLSRNTNNNFPPNCTSIGSFFPLCDPGGSAYVQPFHGLIFDPTSHDAIIIEFDKNGILQWSTFVGGIGDESSTTTRNALAVDPMDRDIIYLVGTTPRSEQFPIRGPSGSYQQSFTIASVDHAYIIKFINRDLIWGTLFGNGLGGLTVGRAVTVDQNGNVYIAGNTRVQTPVSANDYCQVPSASGSEFPICPCADIYFQEDGSGNPIHNGGSDEGFMAGFNTNSQLIWSTYYGGNENDRGHSATYDPVSDRIYFSGRTESVSFFPIIDPGTQNTYIQNDNGGGDNDRDAFIARFCAIQCIHTSNRTEPQLKGESAFSIFPNPSNGEVVLQYPDGPSRFARVQVFNAIGECILDLKEQLNSTTLNLSDQMNGIYFVKISSENNVVARIFILQ